MSGAAVFKTPCNCWSILISEDAPKPAEGCPIVCPVATATALAASSCPAGAASTVPAPMRGSPRPVAVGSGAGALALASCSTAEGSSPAIPFIF